MKKNIFIAITSLIFIFSVSYLIINTVSSKKTTQIIRGNVTYQGFSDVKEMTDYCDTIVIAKTNLEFKDMKSDFDTFDGPLGKSFGLVRTIAPFKVLKVLKGDKNLKEIMISQPAANGDGNFYPKNSIYIQNEGYTITKPNVKYIFALCREKEGYYSITAYEQSKFNIDGKDIEEEKMMRKSDIHKKLKSDITQNFNTQIIDETKN